MQSLSLGASVLASAKREWCGRTRGRNPAWYAGAVRPVLCSLCLRDASGMWGHLLGIWNLLVGLGGWTQGWILPAPAAPQIPAA
jgi:hypothetical protein